MNVLIMTDLEGISGVDYKEQVHDTSSDGYRYACERLMADLNAAVEGAKRAGADIVYVVDGHGSGKNFIDSKLDPRATKVSVSEFCRMLEDVEIDAYLEIGAHAMPHTPNAFLGHVMSSAKWYNYRINGVCCGEIAMGALYAGMHGVPCVMVSGDTAACAEARSCLGDNIACAEVKKGLCWTRAECIDLNDAEKLIRDAVEDGIRRRNEIKPFTLPMPLRLTLELLRADICDAFCEKRPDLTRIDARTVERVAEEIKTYDDTYF